jgi:hypothetical protein
MSPRSRSALLALGALLLAAPARAVTIGFDPSATTASPGDPVLVDVVVSDLAGEIVSAYDLDVVFDASVLSATSVNFSAALGSAGQAFYDASAAPGLVDLAGVSLLSDAALLAIQGGDRVTLATLAFTKTGDGATSLDFVFDAVNDVKGADAQVLALAIAPGSVGPPVTSAVPEPTAALVFSAGLLVLGWAGRRRL